MPVIELSNFSGGVNTRSSPIWTPGDGKPVEFQDADNMELSETGILKYHGNDNALNSAISGTPTITGIFSYKSGSTLKLVVTAGTKIYTAASGTTTEIHTGQTSGAFYQAQMWNDGTNDCLIMCNGVDKVVIYDGTTAAQISETDTQGIWDDARPQGVEVFNNRLIYWGDPNKPYRLYFPRPQNIADGEAGYANFDDAEDTAGALDVAPGYGGALTGVKTLTDDLCILYKENAILRLSGYSTDPTGANSLTIQGITDEVGCIAPRSINQVGNDHYFMAINGMRQLRPVEAYGDAEHLQPTFNIQSAINDINWSNESAYKNICATYFAAENHIYIAVPTGSSLTNNKIYVFDTISRSIDPRSGFSAAVLAVHNRTLYHGDYAGQIYDHGSDDTYNGTAIESFALTKWLSIDGIGTYKNFKKLIVFAEGGNTASLAIQWQIMKRGAIRSNSATESIVAAGGLWGIGLWGTATWSAASQTVFHKKMLGRGVAIRFRFTNNESNQRPIIRKIFLEYDVWSTKKG